MSWFGEGLSNLKGQITNFTKEVLAEAATDESGVSTEKELEEAQKKLSEYQVICASKDAEISRLQQRAQELEARLKLPQPSAASPNVLQPHLTAAAFAGPSSAGSAIEEEQDGWSQFSEEEFPCLQETGDFPVSSGLTPTLAASKDDERDVLRARLQDAEARLQELEQKHKEEQEKEVSGVHLSCQHLLKQIITLDEKGTDKTEGRTEALGQLVSLLGGRLSDEAATAQVQEECSRLKINLEQSEKKTSDIKAQVESLREENVTLTRSLEELDEQNQVALERLVTLKDTLSHEKDVLQEKLATANTEAQQKLDEYISELEKQMRNSLSQSLPESIVQEINGADSSLALVRAVARQCADLLWKKEASERKLAEVTREVRELRQELTTSRSETAKLREHTERLMSQLSVTAPSSSSSGALEPIPEDREEDIEVTFEDVTEPHDVPSQSSLNVESLQREAEALREARENLEAEVSNLRSANESLSTRMRSMGAELRNQENMQREATSQSEKIAELQQKLQDEMKHSESVRNDLLVSQRQISELQTKLKSLATHEEELEQCKISLETTLGHKEIFEQALQEEIGKLKQELDQEVTIKKSTQLHLDTLQQEIKVLQQSLSDKTKLECELQTCKTNISETTKENETLKIECSDLSLKIKEKCEEINSLNSQLQTTHAELENVQFLFEEQKKVQKEAALEMENVQNYSEQIRTLTESNAELQRKCEEVQENLKTSEQCLQNKSRELEKGIEEKLRLDSECKRLQLEVENALAEKLQLQQMLAQQSSRIDELQTSLQDEVKHHEELIKQEKQANVELAAKYGDMEKAYRDIMNVAETLENETQKWKAQAEIVVNKTEEDDSLIKRLESEISDWRNKAENIEESYQMTSQGYQEIVKAMEAKVKIAQQLEDEVEKLSLDVESLTESLNLKCIECSNLEDNIRLLEQQQQELKAINTELSAAVEQDIREQTQEVGELKASLKEMENMKLELSIELQNLNELLLAEKEKLESQIAKSALQSEEILKLQKTKEILTSDNQKLKEELLSSIEKLSSLETEKLNQKSYQPIHAEFHTVQKQKQSLENECLELKQQINDFGTIKQQLSTLQTERSNILGVLDEKTRENASLRSENHKLMALVATEKATSQQLLQEKMELLSRKEFQSSEASEMARESVASLAKIIRDKDQELEALKSKNQSLLTLMQDSNPGLAIHQLFSQHPDIEIMKNEVSQLQQERAQLMQSLQLKHQESLQYHAEIQRLTAALSDRPVVDTNSGRAADTEHLMQSLSQEQQRNKFLQNEVQELSEKESSLQAELGRLRQHLVTVEEQYTEEALRSEQLTQELRNQLAIAEERARNTVSSLSSASARAGQQVELLQEQARTATAQRDDALRRLTAAEDEVRHHAAGLRNLQSVLEQFQQDKDREIELACEKLRQQLRLADQRSEQLIADIKGLQCQLQEAKEGLGAAARLGVQMDKKTEHIASLKDEVAKLNEQLHQAQQQINSASQSMEGKVDKYLIKNLIVGYFMTAPNNRQEALRIVATVLDFSREERTRVGLDAGPSRSGAAAKGGSQAQSLAEAFIRFLENESRPAPQVRMLEDAVGRQRKSSAPGRSPLLMGDMVLPSFAPVPTMPTTSSPGSSSSTLKEVLRDS